MAKYLDPKADLTFKKIFGEHPELVISLLNALLPFSEEQRITEIEYLPAELTTDNPMRKNSIVDVRCKATDGRQAYADKLCQRIAALESAAPSKTFHLTLVSTNGLSRNEYSDIFTAVLTIDELFVF